MQLSICVDLQKQMLFRRTVSRPARQLTYHSISAKFRQAFFGVFCGFFSEKLDFFDKTSYLCTLSRPTTRCGNLRPPRLLPAAPYRTLCRFYKKKSPPTSADGDLLGFCCLQSNAQRGNHAAAGIDDLSAVGIGKTIIADTIYIIRIVARRTQPPPTVSRIAEIRYIGPL